jgi:putative hemolysin
MAASVQRAPVLLPSLAAPAPLLPLAGGPYRLRMALAEEDRAALYRLRFEVFNLELNEGLEAAYATGEDSDEFDPVFDHLMLEHAASGQAVGTYRLQTGAMARHNLGFYSEREFDFAPYASLCGEVVELGRACIHRDHRSFEALTLLWRGVALYAAAHRARYFIGCCSLTSQEPQLGWDVYHHLAGCLAAPELRTGARGGYSLAVLPPSGVKPHIPKLLRTYLAVGAQIASTPALDREFKTIDYLTVLDLERLAPSLRARFLGA